MIFSRWETRLFLLATALAGWLLYPSEYTRGLMLRQEGDRARSIAFFTGYLARHPNHKGAALALVSAYEAAGRPEEAARPLLALYRRRRGDAELGRRVQALLESAGQTGQALAFRKELLRDLRALPAPPQAELERLLYAWFQEAAAAQDDQGALAALGQLAELGAGASGYRDELLRLLLERRMLGEALRLLRRQAGAAPADLELRRLIARILLLRGDEAGALGELARALEAAPGDPGARSDRAELHMKKQRWIAAEDDLRALARLQPAEPSWTRELGTCLIRQGRKADGMALYEGLIARAPHDPQRWWDAVYGWSELGEHAKAAERLELYRQRFPDDEKTAGALVHAYQSMGRLDLAIAALERRVREAPQDDARRRDLVHLLVAEERYEDAVAHYERLIARAPADPQLRKDLAYVHQTRGDDAAAVRVLEEQLRVQPDDAYALDALAGLYLELGRRERAIELLRGYFRPPAGAPPPARAAPR